MNLESMPELGPKAVGFRDQSITARDITTPHDVLRRLSDSISITVRASVAKNPMAPVDILQKLSVDLSNDARFEVAKNPSTPRFILRYLATDVSGTVRSAVALNGNTPVDILWTLAEDLYWPVRRDILWNTSTPIEIVTRIFDVENQKNEPECFIIRAVYANKKLPTYLQDVIKTKYQDIFFYVKGQY